MAVYLPGSGYITLNNPSDQTKSINHVFGVQNSVTPYGDNLLAYVGKTWYKANTATGVFAAPLKMPDDFWDKGPINPVTPAGYRVYNSSYPPTAGSPSGYTNQAVGGTTYTFTVPLYATLTVEIYGGSGGSGGTDGTYQSGSSGTAGTASAFGKSPQSVYGTGAPGGGGTHGGGAGSSGAGSIGYPQGGAAPSGTGGYAGGRGRSEEHTSELQSH